MHQSGQHIGGLHQSGQHSRGYNIREKIQIDDDGNVTVTDAEEDEEGIPSISLIPVLISIGLIARYRRK